MKKTEVPAEKARELVLDALGIGSELWLKLRALEGCLQEQGMPRPDLHRLMKNYYRIWDSLGRELELSKAVADGHSVIQRLGGGKELTDSFGEALLRGLFEYDQVLHDGMSSYLTGDETICRTSLGPFTKGDKLEWVAVDLGRGTIQLCESLPDFDSEEAEAEYDAQTTYTMKLEIGPLLAEADKPELDF